MWITDSCNVFTSNRNQSDFFYIWRLSNHAGSKRFFSSIKHIFTTEVTCCFTQIAGLLFYDYMFVCIYGFRVFVFLRHVGYLSLWGEHGMTCKTFYWLNSGVMAAYDIHLYIKCNIHNCCIDYLLYRLAVVNLLPGILSAVLCLQTFISLTIDRPWWLSSAVCLQAQLCFKILKKVSLFFLI